MALVGRGELPQGPSPHEEDWVLGLGVGPAGTVDPGATRMLQIPVQLCLRAQADMELREEEEMAEAEGLSPSNSVWRL